MPLLQQCHSSQHTIVVVCPISCHPCLATTLWQRGYSLYHHKPRNPTSQGSIGKFHLVSLIISVGPHPTPLTTNCHPLQPMLSPTLLTDYLSGRTHLPECQESQCPRSQVGQSHYLGCGSNGHSSQCSRNQEGPYQCGHPNTQQSCVLSPNPRTYLWS